MPKEVFERLKQAYLMMAKYARYRPQAPSDGAAVILFLMIKITLIR
jgi:hypothetical protein